MTDKEKAEYYDQWHEYFEPLARIRSGVVKALPYWKSVTSDRQTYPNQIVNYDREVRPELENLIQTIINEIEDIEQTAPIQGG